MICTRCRHIAKGLLGWTYRPRTGSSSTSACRGSRYASGRVAILLLLDVRGRFLRRFSFDDALNANCACKPVEGSADQDIFTKELAGLLLVIVGVPHIIIVVFQNQPHAVLGDDFPAECLHLGTLLHVLRDVALFCITGQKGAAEQKRNRRNNGSRSSHVSPQNHVELGGAYLEGVFRP